MVTRTDVAEELKMHFSELKNTAETEIASMIFRSTANLRLTRVGMTAYSRVHTAFTHTHKRALLPRHLMGIGREITSPYYLSEKLFIIFSEEDAMMIKLCGGIDRFLETLD